MAEHQRERVGALVLIAGGSAVCASLSILCLTQWSATSVPGVAVSAVVLLAGAAYGLVGSAVALLRRPRAAKSDAAGSNADRAAE